MSASTHVIFRISKKLSEKLRAVGDSSISESLQAKQMLILAVNGLDIRHLKLILQVITAMEGALGKSVRSRQNDLIEPFEAVCNIIKCKVDAACAVVALDDNERSNVICKISKELFTHYRRLRLKSIKCKCPKCNKAVKKYHHLSSYEDRLCAKCLDKHINKAEKIKSSTHI